MGFTRKEIILFISTFVATVVVVALTFGYVKTAEFKNEELRDELFELTVLLNSEKYDGDRIEKLLNRTVTKGHYAKKEAKAKEYFSMINDVVKTLEDTVRGSDFLSTLTLFNFQTDAPEFQKTYKLIDKTYESLDIFLNDYYDVMDEEVAKKYITDSVVMKTLDIENNKVVMTRRVTDFKKFVEQTEDVINFLRDNDTWTAHVDEGEMSFTDYESAKLYRELTTKLDYSIVD